MQTNLEDKYKLENGIRFLTGTQALVRIPLVQIRKDIKNNLKTACYISGYRGSPLGGYDQQILKNIDYLKDNNIFFQPGINAGLNMEEVIEVISKGAAQSWQMENRYGTMLDEKFDFGFAVDWMRKDLSICFEEAKKNNAKLPITEIIDK